MVKYQTSGIGRQVDVGIWRVLAAWPREILNPLAGLVANVTRHKVMWCHGGKEGKQLGPAEPGDISLENLLRLPGNKGMPICKGRPLGFQKDGSRLMTHCAEDLARVSPYIKARFVHEKTWGSWYFRIFASPPSQISRTEIDLAFDLNGTNLKLRYLGDRIQGSMGQQIGSGFRIMEGH